MNRGRNVGGPPPAGFAAALSFLVRGLLAGGGHASFPWFAGFRVWAGNMSHADPNVVPERLDDVYPGCVFALPFPSSSLRLWPVLPVSAPVGRLPGMASPYMFGDFAARLLCWRPPHRAV